MASSSENLTTNSGISYIPESTHWKEAAEAMSYTFSEEVHRMVTHFSNLSSVNLDGTSLTIGQVTAISRCADILENLHKAVKQVVVGTAENIHPFFKLYKEDLIRVVDRQQVFSYVDDPGNPDNKLISQLRDILVQKAFKGGEDGAEALKMVPKYQEELIERLEDEVAKAREQFAQGDYAVGMRIKKCKTYPVYRFVREEVGTEMLTGEKKVSPGEYIEKVYDAIKEGKIDGVVIDCIAAWNKRN